MLSLCVSVQGRPVLSYPVLGQSILSLFIRIPLERLCDQALRREVKFMSPILQHGLEPSA